MKKLIVCGDSFMSPVITFSGTHFSEIFAKELDFDLTCFSRSGMSNGGIAIQLITAIDLKPDLIIFNTTGIDRIEIPVKDDTKIFTTNPSKFNEKWEPYTVDNLLYTQAVGLSTHSEFANKDPKILSMSILDLLQYKFQRYMPERPNPYEKHNNLINIDKVENFEEKVECIKNWFMFMYDESMKKFTDMFMLYGVMTKLKNSDIPFMWVHDCLYGNGVINLDDLPRKSMLHYQMGSKFDRPVDPNFKDPGYHTTFEAQKEIAQILIEHYKNNFT